MEKKYKVQLPAKNKLGILAHQFIEVKIADKFYTAIKNAKEKEIDVNHTYSLEDLISLRLNLIRKHSFLEKVDQNFYYDEKISKYEFYQQIALDLKDLRDSKTRNIIVKILTGDQHVRGEVDNYILDIFNIIKYNKLLKKLRGLDSELSISTENQEILSILSSNYEIDFDSLEGAPRSIFLIEYLLIKKGIIPNYFCDFGKKNSNDYQPKIGNQKERGEKFKNLYGTIGENTLRNKSKYGLIDRYSFESLLKQNDILEKSILFVYSNLSENKENIDLKLLIELLDIWKTNRNS
ncbi:hypothetical protein [Elizabethkingia meningoseptica]|uniref:hypothetical protein n=1 Tax=Elizabethkingia meningoseptica TaxID=238 RepID=UPI0038923D74